MKRMNWTIGLAVAMSLFVCSAGAQSAQAALDAIKTYEFGQSRQALDRVAAMVVAAAGTPGQQALANDLVTLLQGDATLACKQFVCRQLAVIATEAQVDAIAALLLDEALSDMARYALQPIAGDAVDRALLDALKNTGDADDIRVGLIASLGARRTERAVTPLRKTAVDGNTDVARAAVAALGRIGSARAGRALASVKRKVAPELADDVSQAQLMIADNLLAAGKLDPAEDVFESLVNSEEPDAVRRAAFIGLAKTGGLDDDNEEWRARIDADPALREAAAGYLRTVADRYNALAERQTAR